MDVLAKGSTPVKFIIYCVENAAQKTKEINNLIQESNANSEDIQLKKATNECIVLHVEMVKDVLFYHDKLICAIKSFRQRVFQQAVLETEDSEEMFVVMTPAEDDLDGYLDPEEPVVQSKTTNLESGYRSLVLNLEVKNEVFGTTENFEKTISEFVYKLIKKTNGKQLFPQNETHIVIEPDENYDLDLSYGPSQPVLQSNPINFKSGDSSLVLNMDVKKKDISTTEKFEKSIGATSRNKDRDVIVVKNIPKNVREETLENYLEVICKVDVDGIYFHGLPKCKQVSEVAIVLLKEKLEDLTKTEEKSRMKTIEGQIIQLCKLDSPMVLLCLDCQKKPLKMN